MPHYRVTYFVTRGRAEPMRLLLSDAGVDFEDRRLTEEQWDQDCKQSGEFPLHQLPILEIDGKVMVQSRAIMRHLSRKYGYNGNSEDEATQIDVVCEAVEDLTLPMWETIFGTHDEAAKAQIKEKWLKTTMPLHLKFLEKVLEDNSEGNGYFVGKDITMADFMYYAFIESVVNVVSGALDDYPKLRANREVVKSREKIASYLSIQKPSFM